VNRARFTIHCDKQTLELGERSLLMGTINVTPDSFSDGGLFFQTEQAIKQGELLTSEGADLLDIGGESTRPFSDPLPLEEELRRVIPAAKVPLVLMHMQGTPQNMQVEPHYDSLFSEIIAFMEERIKFACAGGVSRERIIVDPGIGFGKTVNHNLLLIKHLDNLATLGLPILLGTSRKSFIGAVLDKEVTEREPGTWATVCAGIIKGAHIIRVHEVATCRQLADMTDAIMNAQRTEHSAKRLNY
jgi:dihydropteroate synthase